MTSGRAVIAVLLICTSLLLHAHSVDSLQCYMCVSGVGSYPCNDPFKPDGNYPRCTTVGNQVCSKSKVNSDVVRGCAPQLGQPLGCQHASESGQTVHQCFCNTDLCNSAPRTTLTTFTFISACALTTFIYSSLF